MPSRRNATTTLSAFLLAAALGGCYGGTGGSMHSGDKYTYESRPLQPKSIEVVDVRTEQVVWAMDIPVGSRLTIDFTGDKKAGAGQLGTADMRWKLRGTTTGISDESGTVEVPTADSRRVDMFIREAPEFPQIDAPIEESASAGG